MSHRRIRSLSRRAAIVVLTAAALGTGVLGAWTYPSHISLHHYPHDSSLLKASILVGRGAVGFQTYREIAPPPPTTCDSWFYFFGFNYWQKDEADRAFRRDGVLVRRIPCFRTTFMRAPVWVPFILFAIYPTIAFIRGPLRRYRRRKKGLCLTCGYDLRASLDRCPECGREGMKR